MSDEVMSDSLYFEDLELHAPIYSREYEISEAEIIEYAMQWNPEPYHIDPDVAASSPMGRIFAAGPHLIAICTKLTNEFRPRPETVAGMGWDELRFKTPGFGGDRLRVENQVLSKRRSNSNPSVGIAVYGLRLLNQNDEEVLTYSVTCMVKCRTQGSNP